MKVKEKVEKILKDYPSTRNSDQELILMVWWYYHRDKLQLDERKQWWVKLSDIKDLEKTESIRRIRQKFQEEGLYQASEEIKKQRGKYQEDMRQAMPGEGAWEYADYLNQ